MLADKPHRDLAEGLNIGAPVVDAEEIEGHLAEHMRDLVRAHGGVRTQRGQNRLEPVAVILPRITGQVAGAGTHPLRIGDDDVHADQWLDVCQGSDVGGLQRH